MLIDQNIAIQSLLSQQDHLGDSTVLSKILNAIAVPIFIQDAQRRYLFLNDAFCQLPGMAPAELIGKTAHELDLSLDLPEDLGAFREVIQTIEMVDQTGSQVLLVGALEKIDPDQSHHLKRREQYLQTLVEIQQGLLQGEYQCFQRDYTPVLECLGRVTGASRVYLFENSYSFQEKLLMNQRVEWCAPGIHPELENPIYQNLPYADFNLEFAEALGRGEVVSSLVRDLPEPMQSILATQNILSILVLPLMVQGKFFGFMGFDNCFEAKAWEPSEINLISAAASAISLHLERHQAQLELQEREEQFRQLAENINSVFWINDPRRCQMLYLSPAYQHLWGRSQPNTHPDPMALIEGIHPADRQGVMAAISRQVQGTYDEEYRIVRPNGEIRWIRDRAFPIQNAAGKTYRVVGIAEDISERKQNEIALRLIVEGTAAKIGDQFFHSLVHHLAEALQVRYALVTRFVPGTSDRVRTLAFWNGNDFGENFEYDLQGSPCYGVMQGEHCHYPEQVQSHFPTDLDLVNLGVESYSGIPLKDSTQQILGHLAVMDTEPMTNHRIPQLIVEIFAARAGAELERLQFEETLRATQQRLQYLVTASPAIIYTCSPEPGNPITFISENIQDVLGYVAHQCLAEAKTFWGLRVHPEDVPHILVNLQKLATQDSIVNEYRFTIAMAPIAG
ncbi:MAG: PAS domain-containing protein [Oscillatoriales cyanobacterium RM2_1_1]|nr:PAS domain-containing protein [Oscillatoriales cyanobacterium RM2_1_1]